MEGGAGGETDAMPEADALEFTPTWIVAGVCSLIVVISLAVERFLHYIGKVTSSSSPYVVLVSPGSCCSDLFCTNAHIQTLKRKNQKALFEALLKVKEGRSTSIHLFFREQRALTFLLLNVHHHTCPQSDKNKPCRHLHKHGLFFLF
jgi:hypothetical protein